MANKTPNSIEMAGDYDLNHVFLHDHMGGVTDIKKLMSELNVFESIFKNALTGSIVVTDAQNLIAKLEINGTERISFKLSTPGADKKKRGNIDASVETGQPFYVYKITDRRQIAPGTLLYTLHFASREFIRNLRTKVSQTYRGNIAYQVIKILMDENYLDSQKEISYEPTGNINDVVIPNMRPFDAINMIAKKSLPEKSGGVGYYFYETTKGLYFRSWDNMVTVKGSFDRPIKQEFYYMPMNIDDKTIQDKINHDFKSVESYEFINNFHDVAANTALGTYGHRVISYNLFDKSVIEHDYNYHNFFEGTKHTDNENNYRDAGKTAIASSPVDYDNQRSVSDYPESRVSLQATTQFLHNKKKGAKYGLDVFQDSSLKAQRVSQYNQVVHGTTLKLVVKGQSYLEPGDLIEFKIRPIDSDNTDLEEDNRYSGQYVITKIRHQITSDIYTMVLECVKDSVVDPIVAGEPQYKATKRKGDLEDIYDSSTNIYNRHN